MVNHLNDYLLAVDRAEVKADPTPVLLAEKLGYSTPWHIREWWEAADRYKYLLLLATRRHAKSRSLAILKSLKRLQIDPNRQILLVGETHSTVARWVREMAQLIEHPSGILSYLKPEKNIKWGTDEFIVARNSMSGEPSVRAVGVGGSMLGSGADDIIGDDIVSLVNSATIAKREKLTEWFDNVLTPILKKDGHMTIIGTPWYEDDHYAHLRALAPVWKTMEYPAIGDYPGLILSGDYLPEVMEKMIKIMETRERVIAFLSSYPGGALWPEEYPMERLMEMKRLMGSIAFARQFMLDLSLIEGGMVKKEWFKWHTKLPDAPLIWRIGVDPSLGKTETSHYTGIVVDAKDKTTGKHYIEYQDAGRWQAHGRTQAISKMYNLCPESHIVIEDSSVTYDYIGMLRRDTDLPIKPISPRGRDKVSRLNTITPAMERGDISFNVRLKASLLVRQLIEFPKGTFDDLVDAWVYAIMSANQSGGFVGIAKM